MYLISELNMRIIYSIIIIAVLTLIVPGISPAADLNYSLFATLKSEPSLPDIFHSDNLINEPEPLRGSFLVATPRLKGSFFANTVILMLNHSDRGSSGLIINRPPHVNLSDVHPDINKFDNITDNIYIGGPVEMKSFLILIQSDVKPPKSEHFIGNLHLSASIETLKYLYKQSGTDDNIRVFFGYSGWIAGQLINEVERGSWHVMDGDTGLVFDNNTDELWDMLIQRRTHASQNKRDKSSEKKKRE